MLVDPTEVRQLLEAAIAALSMLGGAMAYLSGFGAAQALRDREPPEVVTQRINEGIGNGFLWGAVLGAMALIIVLWSS